MAKVTEIVLTDDITGESADETVTFALDGVGYEIDLSEGNAKELRGALAGFIESGRKLGKVVIGGRTTVSRSTPSTDREQNQAIREWAAGQGMKISERGRIPANVLEAFHAKH